MKSKKNDSALFKPGDLIMPDLTCGNTLPDLESIEIDLWTVKNFKLYEATRKLTGKTVLINKNDTFIYMSKYFHVHFTYDVFYFKNEFFMVVHDSIFMSLIPYVA